VRMIGDPVLEPDEVVGADLAPLQDEGLMMHAVGFAPIGYGSPAKSPTTSRCAAGQPTFRSLSLKQDCEGCSCVSPTNQKNGPVHPCEPARSRAEVTGERSTAHRPTARPIRATRCGSR
jgi:hypothetical protein